MATNNFLPFTPTDTGTNLLTQAEYAAASDRTNGNQPGVASSKLNNKAIRQANVIASQLAQYISNKTGSNMLDDGNLTNILNAMIAGFAAPTQEYEISNLTLATSVATSALTIAVKTRAGTDPSATDLITAGMRSSTLTSGIYNTRTLSSALSLVISSGSTLGQTSAQPSVIFVYFIDNAGTLELAVSHSFYAENALVTTVAEGGAGGADSATAIYSQTLRSNVPIRLIGYVLNTQATAGTWASAGTQIQLQPVNSYQAPDVQRLVGTGTYVTPAGAKKLTVLQSGGGGSGGSSGSSGGSNPNGNTGSSTTFGSSLLTCTGGGAGAGGGNSATGGAGGTATVNSPAIAIITMTGGAGNTNGPDTSSAQLSGGMGGANRMGGAGASTYAGAAGGAGADGTGAGGAGGSTDTTPTFSGIGGGSGGYLEAYIMNPDSSYPYQVGAGGVANSGGTSGFAGGAGAKGFITVIAEF